jgi:hypothetical protein
MGSESSRCLSPIPHKLPDMEAWVVPNRMPPVKANQRRRPARGALLDVDVHVGMIFAFW